MEFQEPPEHTAIREAVRDICKGFDAEYWRAGTTDRLN